MILSVLLTKGLLFKVCGVSIATFTCVASKEQLGKPLRVHVSVSLITLMEAVATHAGGAGLKEMHLE